jgi:hypothetical protein
MKLQWQKKRLTTLTTGLVRVRAGSSRVLRGVAEGLHAGREHPQRADRLQVQVLHHRGKNWLALGFEKTI